ncbi:MAG: histidine phosphatase family protein [Candidatus Aureabacteria bacterium]|nr:histidine phosphatase family protein [Candidatus Auribacterota bacterium]
MMDLTFLRHGAATSQAITDEERALTEAGKNQVKRLALCLKESGETYDRIFSSPLRRAIETAQIFGEMFGKPIASDSRLACGCRLEMIRELAEECEWQKRLLFVGHSPDFELISAQLLGIPNTIDFKKGAALKLSTTLISPGTGSLFFFIHPELIGRDL